ncbi:MAG: hypothetical protein QF878_04945 [SAR202 cluster bacterium]|nr:hypothetical protein [SAR202 cluster bacterium]MDP6716610.1 hypothetical protein [SAR202 cluster bacterium]
MFVGVGRGVDVGTGVWVGTGVAVGTGVGETNGVTVTSTIGDGFGLDAHPTTMIAKMYMAEAANLEAFTIHSEARGRRGFLTC